MFPKVSNAKHSMKADMNAHCFNSFDAYLIQNRKNNILLIFRCFGPGTPLIKSGSQFPAFCRIEWVKWMDMSREMTLDLVISGQDLFH